MAKKSMEEIISKMVEKLLTYEPGSWESTARLYENLFGPTSNDIDLFDLDCELKTSAEKAGIYLDTSSHMNSLVGLPYNLPFQVMRIAPEKMKYEDIVSVSFSINVEMSPESVDVLINLGEDGTVQVKRGGLLLEELEGDAAQPAYGVDVSLFHDLIATLSANKVLDWKRYYDPIVNGVVVLDGFRWNIALIDSNCNCLLSEGSNAVPEGFDQVLDALKAFGVTWEETYEPDCVVEGTDKDPIAYLLR